MRGAPASTTYQARGGSVRLDARTTTATPTGAEQNHARSGLKGTARRYAPLWPRGSEASGGVALLRLGAKRGEGSGLRRIGPPHGSAGPMRLAAGRPSRFPSLCRIDCPARRFPTVRTAPKRTFFHHMMRLRRQAEGRPALGFRVALHNACSQHCAVSLGRPGASAAALPRSQRPRQRIIW